MGVVLIFHKVFDRNRRTLLFVQIRIVLETCVFQNTIGFAKSEASWVWNEYVLNSIEVDIIHNNPVWIILDLSVHSVQKCTFIRHLVWSVVNTMFNLEYILHKNSRILLWDHWHFCFILWGDRRWSNIHRFFIPESQQFFNSHVYVVVWNFSKTIFVTTGCQSHIINNDIFVAWCLRMSSIE